MTVIYKDITLEGSKGKKDVSALFDSGSTYSCIKPRLAEELEIILPLLQPIEFETAEDARSVKAQKRVLLNFYIDGYRFSDEFMVIEGLSEDAIIGAKTLQAWRIKLDFEHEKVIIDPKVTKLRFG